MKAIKWISGIAAIIIVCLLGKLGIRKHDEALLAQQAVMLDTILNAKMEEVRWGIISGGFWSPEDGEWRLNVAQVSRVGKQVNRLRELMSSSTGMVGENDFTGSMGMPFEYAARSSDGWRDAFVYNDEAGRERSGYQVHVSFNEDDGRLLMMLNQISPGIDSCLVWKFIYNMDFDVDGRAVDGRVMGNWYDRCSDKLTDWNSSGNNFVEDNALSTLTEVIELLEEQKQGSKKVDS